MLLRKLAVYPREPFMVPEPEDATKSALILDPLDFVPVQLALPLRGKLWAELAAAVLYEPVDLPLSGLAAQRFPVCWLQRFPFPSPALQRAEDTPRGPYPLPTGAR